MGAVIKALSLAAGTSIAAFLVNAVSGTEAIIEFGIGDIRKCNSTNLALSFGWTGLLIDGSAEEIKEGLRKAEAAFSRGAPAADDRTILVIKRV